jgi:hypothetical protein
MWLREYEELNTIGNSQATGESGRGMASQKGPNGNVAGRAVRD